MSNFDIHVRQLAGRFELRTFWRFGVAHYGCYRYLRIGKIGIRLWRIS